MTKRRRDEDEEIVQFYSKSKDADDLNISIPDWRKRLSNFWPCQVEVAGRSYPSVEHAFHGGSVDRAGPCFRTNVNSPFFVACIPPPTHQSINQSINQSKPQRPAAPTSRRWHARWSAAAACPRTRTKPRARAARAPTRERVPSSTSRGGTRNATAQPWRRSAPASPST